ncbi:MAG: histidine phosphatase family protein [Oscillospiraceae bacterium]|nr:histidine phosphatase family protein [Oscillospiraceae bacterium]
MNSVYLIRHGATAGNLERRYIGCTDEALCPLGREQAMALRGALPRPELLFSSPMLRARETAALLFPGLDYSIVPELRETDFGIFEGKSAAELSENASYRAWVEGGCTGPIPGGEAVTEFKARTVAAFAEAMAAVPSGVDAAFVLHGGGIMAVMEALAFPEREFYAWYVGNCGYFRCEWNGGRLTLSAAKTNS